MTEVLPPPPGQDEHEAFQRPQQEDYFGFQEFEKYYFPDGQSWVEFQKLNEGQRARFQKASSRDLVLERRSGDARMKVDPAADRHALIQASLTDWNLKRNGEPVPFSERNIKDFLQLANPRVIEDLEKAIRKANPWLLADMSVEDIDKEIENLQEMRSEIEEREAGKLASSNK